jgi:hypothetical protein
MPIFLIVKNQLYSNIIKIGDYENYYTDRKKIKRVYLLFTLLQYILILAIALILSGISSFSNIIMPIILINVIILLLPNYAYLIWRFKHV